MADYRPCSIKELILLDTKTAGKIKGPEMGEVRAQPIRVKRNGKRGDGISTTHAHMVLIKLSEAQIAVLDRMRRD